jgi:hypothetical protein
VLKTKLARRAIVIEDRPGCGSLIDQELIEQVHEGQGKARYVEAK